MTDWTVRAREFVRKRIERSWGQPISDEEWQCEWNDPFADIREEISEVAALAAEAYQAGEFEGLKQHACTACYDHGHAAGVAEERARCVRIVAERGWTAAMPAGHDPIPRGR